MILLAVVTTMAKNISH